MCPALVMPYAMVSKKSPNMPNSCKMVYFVMSNFKSNSAQTKNNTARKLYSITK